MGQYDSSTDDPGSRTLLPERSGTLQVTDLSRAEELLIYRRRCGFSQSKMAKTIGVHRNTYGRAERGETKIPVITEVLPLFPWEECLLLRRRSGWTQQKCANLMGITRYWYNMMENSHVSSKALEEFWNER